MSKFTFSLNKLLSNLIDQPNNREYINLPDEEIRGTTIRLEPALRKFCEDQAGKLNTSYQSFIAMVLKGVMLETTQPVKSEIILLQERFFDVFKRHNFAVADIPEVLKDFNISLSTLANEERLLDKIGHNLINYLAGYFFVNTEWLMGKSNRERQGNENWTRSVYKFCSKLLEYEKSNQLVDLVIVKSNKTELDKLDDSCQSNEEISMAIRFQRTTPSKKQFEVYQVMESLPWSYWKTRYKMKAIILFCSMNNITLFGCTSSTEGSYKKLVYEDKIITRTLLNELTVWGNWHPEDCVNYHEEYLTNDTHKPEMRHVYDEFFSSKLDTLVQDNSINALNNLEKIKKYREKFDSTHRKEAMSV